MGIKYFIFGLLLMLNGCVVGPNYRAPVNCVPDEWVGPDIALQAEPLSDWWRVFQDPILDKYIAQAALYNNDILIAEANVIEARAQRQIAASAFYPQIGLDTNISRTRFSENGPFFEFDNFLDVGAQPANIPNPQIPLLQTVINLAFDASWEIDIFGKTKRAVEAAQANLESQIEAQNDILITVLAEVARTYMNVRGFQKQKQLTENNISLLEQIETITFQRVDSGLDNGIDKHNIEAELADLRSTLPNLKREIYLNIYSLSVLLGYNPECLLEEMTPILPLPTPPAEVEIGLRSEILRRRPDVRRAERAFHAATANIGVAVAQFFPSFSIAGFFGLQSELLRKLFEWQSRTWSYADNMSLPIYQGGSLRGNLCAAKANAMAACQVYQKTVLTALQDAQSALTSFTEERASTKQLKLSVEQSKITRDLTLQRYENGLVDLKNLLDYDRLLIEREQQLTISQTAALIDLISLYKALGGGWETLPSCS